MSELYTTSNDAESQPFKDNFGEIAMQLVKDGKLDFQVRYYIYSKNYFYFYIYQIYFDLFETEQNMNVTMQNTGGKMKDSTSW